MRVIHVLRKPLSEGTVSANTLKHGTGGLNIDASRIGAWLTPNASKASAARTGFIKGFVEGTETVVHNHGRWPANVILQHLDGCRCDGVKTAGSGRFVAHDAVVRKSTMIDPDKGWNGNSLDNSKKNAPNSYGQETVANWVCEPGCPVARLDEQTANRLHLAGNKNNSGAGAGKDYAASSYHISYFGQADRDQSEGDTTTGASRFYKQVGGKG